MLRIGFTYVLTVSFLLELSLHEHQQMFTAEFPDCFLLEGTEGLEGCFSLIATQCWEVSVLLK